MDNETIFAILLSRSEQYNKRKAIEQRIKNLSFEDIYKESSLNINQGIVHDISSKINGWKNQGINTVKYGDKSYPYLLANITNPPLIFFYKGESFDQFMVKICFAIVGSRNSDYKGIAIAKQFGRKLAEYGVTVVSGLAIGIDGAAHEGALESRVAASTIAVLGGGINNIYPAKHQVLADRIVKSGGALISQFEPEEKPFPQNFLLRNRVIAGISKGVLVIQAAEKSGALATARYALDEGREVMAIPGSIDNVRHAGTNLLIKQGAQLVTTVEEVIEGICGIGSTQQMSDINNRYIEEADNSDQRSLPKEQAVILEYIRGNQPIQFENLSAKFAEIELFQQQLLELEIGGFILEKPGMWYESV